MVEEHWTYCIPLTLNFLPTFFNLSQNNHRKKTFSSSFRSLISSAAADILLPHHRILHHRQIIYFIFFLITFIQIYLHVFFPNPIFFHLHQFVLKNPDLKSITNLSLRNLKPVNDATLINKKEDPPIWWNWHSRIGLDFYQWNWTSATQH